MFPEAEARAAIEATQRVVEADLRARIVARAYVSVEPATTEWSATVGQLLAALEHMHNMIDAANAAMRRYDEAAAAAASK